MALIGLITDFLHGMTLDGFSFLSELNRLMKEFAASICLIDTVLFVFGILAVTVFGLFGYKLIKLELSLCGAFLGYFAGKELFLFLESRVGDLPDWLIYLFGAVIAALLIVLTFWKFSYAWFCMLGAVTYAVIWYYAPENYLLMLAGSLVVALLSIAMIRTSFVLINSFFCASLGVSFLSACLPDVTWLQITPESYGMAVVAVVAVVFALVEFMISLLWKQEEE